MCIELCNMDLVYLADTMCLINNKTSKQISLIEILQSTDHPPTCTDLGACIHTHTDRSKKLKRIKRH